MPWEGRVEMLQSGVWNAVCGDVGGWKDSMEAATNNAHVVCKQLGYDGGEVVGTASGYVAASGSAGHYSFGSGALGATINLDGTRT